MAYRAHRPLLVSRVPLSGRKAVRAALTLATEPLYPVRVRLRLTRSEVEALEALAQTLPTVCGRPNLGLPATFLLRRGLRESLTREPNPLPMDDAKPEPDDFTEDESLTR